MANFEAEDNLWLTRSELALCGRPLSDLEVQLPLSKDLLLPESLSPEDDLKQAERQRPSAEACCAQKGQLRWVALIQSMLTFSDASLRGKPVIILNLTGYVEDLGCAAAWCYVSGREGFQTPKLEWAWDLVWGRT